MPPENETINSYATKPGERQSVIPPSSWTPRESNAGQSSTPPPATIYTNNKSPVIKKILTILIAIVVLFGIGALVYTNKDKLPFGNKEPKIVMIRYWGVDIEESAMKELIAEYEKNHPYTKITYEKKILKNYRPSLQKALEENRGPDIFRYHNTWFPMFKNKLDAIPSTVMDTVSYEKTFYPITREDIKQKNSYYGIPLEIEGLALFYNEELMRSANMKPPTVWEEFALVAEKLTVPDPNGNIQTAGIAMGTPSNTDYWSDILTTMLLQEGVDLKNPTSENGLGSAKAAAVLDYFTRPVTNAKNKMWDDKQVRSTEAFINGKVAMIFAPYSAIEEIRAANPKLAFNVTQVPRLAAKDGGKENRVTWGRYWVEGVSKDSKNKSQAWDFLKYLSQKETLEKLNAIEIKQGRLGRISPRTDMAQALKLENYKAPYIEQAPFARSWYSAGGTFDEGLNDELIKYLETAVNETIKEGGTAPKAQEQLIKVLPEIEQTLLRYNAVTK